MTKVQVCTYLFVAIGLENQIKVFRVIFCPPTAHYEPDYEGPSRQVLRNRLKKRESQFQDIEIFFIYLFFIPPCFFLSFFFLFLLRTIFGANFVEFVESGRFSAICVFISFYFQRYRRLYTRFIYFIFSVPIINSFYGNFSTFLFF